MQKSTKLIDPYKAAREVHQKLIEGKFEQQDPDRGKFARKAHNALLGVDILSENPLYEMLLQQCVAMLILTKRLNVSKIEDKVSAGLYIDLMFEKFIELFNEHKNTINSMLREKNK